MPEITRGRDVEYIPGEHFNGAMRVGEPLTAKVVHVHSPTLVNLTVFDLAGTCHGLTSVPFFAVGDEPPPGVASYACWPQHIRDSAAEIRRQIAERENPPPAAPPVEPEPAAAGAAPNPPATPDLPL